VPVIPLKTIVRILPEIGLFIGENFQPSAKPGFSGLIEPVEILWLGGFYK
jgi:hypothetical protein